MCWRGLQNLNGRKYIRINEPSIGLIRTSDEGYRTRRFENRSPRQREVFCVVHDLHYPFQCCSDPGVDHGNYKASNVHQALDVFAIFSPWVLDSDFGGIRFLLAGLEKKPEIPNGAGWLRASHFSILACAHHYGAAVVAVTAPTAGSFGMQS